MKRRLKCATATHVAASASSSEAAARNRLLDAIRPRDLPSNLLRVYAHIEPLLMDLLLKGSVDREDDLAQMSTELSQRAFRECARENVCRYELARVMAAAASLGPGDLAAKAIWPGLRVESVANRIRVASLVVAVKTSLQQGAEDGADGLRWLAAMTGNLWGGALPSLPKKRLRSASPRDPERMGVYREIVRDELFVGRASLRNAWRVAKILLVTAPSVATFEQEMKLLRAGKKKGARRVADPRAMAPIPPQFHETLFARRIAALRSPFMRALLDGTTRDAGFGEFAAKRASRRRS
jgi:hypothetical protein